MFDFNKLDDYKVALDDGFTLSQAFFKHIGMQEYDSLVLEKCVYPITRYCLIGYFRGLPVMAFEDKDWETFKKKVADYFLGVDK